MSGEQQAMPNVWGFTFGANHTNADGVSLDDYYVILEGDFNEARAKMFELRGSKWAMQYPYDNRFEEMIEQYGLLKLDSHKAYLPPEQRV